ncbi:hypothetical protein K435DRAFT_674767, partial [Dendrothele bispora CBS 962.96]
FGVDKRRFKILNIAPEYPFPVQAKLPAALGAVHNFIRILDPLDEALGINTVFSFHAAHRDNVVGESFLEDDDEQGILGQKVTAAERLRANERRDRIAQEMWDQYQSYLELLN